MDKVHPSFVMLVIGSSTAAYAATGNEIVSFGIVGIICLSWLIADVVSFIRQDNVKKS